MTHMGVMDIGPPTHTGTHPKSSMYPFAKYHEKLFFTLGPKLLQMTVLSQKICIDFCIPFKSFKGSDISNPRGFDMLNQSDQKIR